MKNLFLHFACSLRQWVRRMKRRFLHSDNPTSQNVYFKCSLLLKINSKDDLRECWGALSSASSQLCHLPCKMIMISSNFKKQIAMEGAKLTLLPWFQGGFATAKPAIDNELAWCHEHELRHSYAMNRGNHLIVWRKEEWSKWLQDWVWISIKTGEEKWWILIRMSERGRRLGCFMRTREAHNLFVAR